MSFTLVLFDIDGTLLRAHGAGKEAFDRAFSELYQVDQAFGSMAVQGRTDPDIILEVSERTLGRPLSPQEAQILADRYIIHLQETLPQSQKFEVMPGVPKLVDLLAQQDNMVLGIQTGNLEAAALLKLKRANLDHHFQIGGYGSDAVLRTEIIAAAISRARKSADREISRVIAIGDSPNDILSGKANGADTIGVLTGGVPREALESSRPDLLLETLELGDELLRFFGLAEEGRFP